MIDPNRFLRLWLLLPFRTLHDGSIVDNPILALFADQTPAFPWPITPIFAGALPEKYDPRQTGNGMAVVIRLGGSGSTEGGTAHSEIPIIDPRMQITIWAGINEYEAARTIDRVIFDWIHGQTPLDMGADGYCIQCLNSVLGQDINDPTTSYSTIVSFWHLTLREN